MKTSSLKHPFGIEIVFWSLCTVMFIFNFNYTCMFRISPEQQCALFSSSVLTPLSVMLMILPFGAPDAPAPLRGFCLAVIAFEAAEWFPH